MRNYFTFGGERSTDYGVYISGQGTFNSPARDVEFVSVPGRNGDLILSNNRFQNGTLTYPASFIYDDFAENMRNLRTWLTSKTGYQRLEDTYHPDEYRMAVAVDPIEPEVLSRNEAGTFDIVFNVKPQRFLKSGDIPIRATTGTDVYFDNPTPFTSLMKLEVHGDGAYIYRQYVDGVWNEAYLIRVSNNNSYVIIDGETLLATRPSDNAQCSVRITTFENYHKGLEIRPKGTAGDASGHADSIEAFFGNPSASYCLIYPRWWVV